MALLVDTNTYIWEEDARTIRKNNSPFLDFVLRTKKRCSCTVGVTGIGVIEVVGSKGVKDTHGMDKANCSTLNVDDGVAG